MKLLKIVICFGLIILIAACATTTDTDTDLRGWYCLGLCKMDTKEKQAEKEAEDKCIGFCAIFKIFHDQTTITESKDDNSSASKVDT